MYKSLYEHMLIILLGIPSNGIAYILPQPFLLEFSCFVYIFYIILLDRIYFTIYYIQCLSPVYS